MTKVKQVHIAALHRRRNELKDNFVAAIGRLPARPSVNVVPEGFVLVRPAGSRQPEYVVWTTPRPPAIWDFHHTHVSGGAGSGRRGLIIAPAPFFVSIRKTHFDWLAQCSTIKYCDEGQLMNVAAAIAVGNF